MSTQQENRYSELDSDIIQHFIDIYNEKSFPIPIGFTFINDSKLKKMVKANKMTGKYQYLIGKEILIEVNEDLYYKFDEKSQRILFEQEIDKISINIDNGKIKMEKPDLVTFSPLVEKYGIGEVARANQVEALTVSQQEDMKEEELTV